MLKRALCTAWPVAMRSMEGNGAAQTTILSTHTAPMLSKRLLCAVAEPDPALNPAPSAKVLDIADAVESLTVKEAVWLNKVLKERLGITDADLGLGMMAAAPAAAPAGGAPTAAAEEPVEEKKDFNVVIEGYESAAKIKIIKELRSVVPDLGLKEAKALVDNLPATVKESVPKEAAEEVQKKLAAVGAQVVLK